MLAPKLLEDLFYLLIPPACREHVLGDLQERYKSPASYVVDGLSVLGPVIMGRIRRTTDLQVFLMELLAVYMSFMTASWYLGDQDFLYHHAGFVRLAVPASVAAVALVFCNAYSHVETSSYSRPILQTAGSLSLAFLGQALVFDSNAHLSVPFPILCWGSCLGLLLVSPVRIFFPPTTRRAQFAHSRKLPPRQFVPVMIPFEHLRARINDLQSRSKTTSTLMILAAAITAFSLLALLNFPKPRLVVLLLVAVVLICRPRAGE